MDFVQIGAAARPVNGPSERSASKPTQTPTSRSRLKPMKHASIDSFVVPVLPAAGRSRAFAALAVPDSTALRIMSVNTKADRLLALGLERDPLRRAESRCVGHTRRGGGD
jgi:hypothetical protein